MSSFATKAILAIALSASTLTGVQSAYAGDRYGWYNDRDYRHERRERRNDALALGVVGLATGLVVGSVLSQPRQPTERVYVDPPVRQQYPAYAEPGYGYNQPAYDDNYYYRSRPQPRPVYETARPAYRTLEPWTQNWYNYCSDRYRSFDAQSGTYTDNSGQQHFCTAG
jgi:hypothetical protein